MDKLFEVVVVIDFGIFCFGFVYKFKELDVFVFWDLWFDNFRFYFKIVIYLLFFFIGEVEVWGYIVMKKLV